MAGAQQPDLPAEARWPTLRPWRGPGRGIERTTLAGTGREWGEAGRAVWVPFFWLEETLSFVPRSQGVSLWGWGVAGSPLARTAPGVGVRAPDSESLAWARGQRGHCWGGGRATIDKAASCGGAQPPGPWPPWPHSSLRAKPPLSPSRSGQCPPQPSRARHHCPGPAELRRCASLGATLPGRPLRCPPARR